LVQVQFCVASPCCLDVIAAHATILVSRSQIALPF